MSSIRSSHRPILTIILVLCVQLGLLAIATAALLGANADLSPWSWLEIKDTATLLLSAGGLFALIIGAVSTIGTLSVLGSLISPRLRFLTSLERLALPVVRNVAASCVSATLTAAVAVGGIAPASATTPHDRTGATSQIVVDDPVVRVITPVTATATTDVVRAVSEPGPQSRAQQAESDRSVTATKHSISNEYTVVHGDNFWSIAERHLSARSNAQAPSSAVATYWSALIAANRGHIKSGDPNLIFAGEVLVLPPLPF